MMSLKIIDSAPIKGVTLPGALATSCTAFAILMMTTGCGNSRDSLNPRTSISNVFQSRDPHKLIKWTDARKLLGGPVGPPVIANPNSTHNFPDCPAYARLTKGFYRRIDYESDNAKILSEFITRKGGDTENLEDLRTCGKEAGNGTVVEIKMRRVSGGPGNIDGVLILDGRWKINVRARVISGDNVIVVTDVDARTADKSISVAVARWGGTPLPNGFSE